MLLTIILICTNKKISSRDRKDCEKYQNAVVALKNTMTTTQAYTVVYAKTYKDFIQFLSANLFNSGQNSFGQGLLSL